jgi:hypothetical protein
LIGPGILASGNNQKKNRARVLAMRVYMAPSQVCTILY